jgi:hypothetical protein
MGIGEVAMKTYNGGDEVKAGFYVNRNAWKVTTLSGKGGTLPGENVDRYVRMPGLLVLLMAPIMGGLFAIFLPFIGIALLLTVGARNVVRRFTTPPPAPVPSGDERAATEEVVAPKAKKAA